MSERKTASDDPFEGHKAKFSNWAKQGSHDQIGTATYITTEHVRTGAALVRTGRVISLGLNFDQNAPQNRSNGRFNCLRYSVATGSGYVQCAQQFSYRTSLDTDISTRGEVGPHCRISGGRPIPQKGFGGVRPGGDAYFTFCRDVHRCFWRVCVAATQSAGIESTGPS